MFVATILYKAGINVEYYLTRHVPRSEELMVPFGVIRSEVRRFAPGPDGTPPEFEIMSTLYFESAEAFAACMQAPFMAELTADVKNFYDGEPLILVGGVVHNPTY
ncbi:MAG TPA: EthD family reductase [Symbiobacteriaceae bacterium]|nr:EthD family reductase [Symbiobacteriaceae bacterium]